MSQPEPFDPDAYDGAGAEGDASPAAVTTGSEPAAAALDEDTARQLWHDAVESYAQVEEHLQRLDDRLSRFVSGQGWKAMGYRTAADMVRGEADSLINPATGKPLSRTSVWRLGRWLTLMDRISVTTGVDAGELDFPSRVLRALPAGRGGQGDQQLAEQIAEGSGRLADADGGVITVDHVQTVVDDLLAERGIETGGGHAIGAGQDAADADGEVSDDGNIQGGETAGTGTGSRRGTADLGATGSDDPSADDPGDDGEDGGEDGGEDDSAARDAARHHMWIMQQVEALGRAVEALGTIEQLKDEAAAIDFTDAARNTELQELRSRFSEIPAEAELVDNVRQAVSQVITAVDEREELGI